MAEEKTEKTQVAETKAKKVLALEDYMGVRCTPMAKKLPKPEKIQFRPKDEDYAIIHAGIRKFGVDQCQVIRIALRKLAEAEGLKAS